MIEDTGAIYAAAVGARPATAREDWAENLASEISNRYELGLTDKEARQLARLIKRRLIDHLAQ